MRLAVRAFVLSGVVSVAMLCSAAVAGAADRVVDDDKVQCPTAPFTSIQAAVTAADAGDRVLVCDGVYQEAVTIGPGKNNLRLVANVVQGAIIQMPPGIGAENAAIVRVTGGATGVEVSRFVIERSPTSAPAAVGIAVINGASLRTARNNLIRRTDASGILVTGGSAPDISYNTIQEYGEDGILADGANTSATMSFNTLIGANSFTGISIINGAKGSAVGNRIVGHPGLAGIQLLLPAPSGVSLKGNQVFDNARGILMQGAQGALVASNRLSRNTLEGIYAFPGSTGNTFDRNDARSNGASDCRDDSTGSGTAGTANTWTFNRGIDPMPPGICTP